MQEQVALLRAGRLDEIDAENVAEELSDVGGEQYDRLESALRVLLMHMLKWDISRSAEPSWSLTIAEHGCASRCNYARIRARNRATPKLATTFRYDSVRAGREMNDRRRKLSR